MTRSRKSSVFRAFLRGRRPVHETGNSYRWPCTGRRLAQSSSCPSGRGLREPDDYNASVVSPSWGEPTASPTPRTEPCEWSRGIVLFLLVQTQFVLNPPCPLALGPQAKNRCPICVRDLSIRAGQRAMALGAKTVFSRFLVAAQPFAKRWPRDATTRAHETGVAGLLIHAHPT